MNKLRTNLQHCYGINTLNHEFDFSEFNTIVIYASNGIMKTSFANTFSALRNGKMPIDRLYRKPTICRIDVDNVSIDSNIISVIKSFEEIDSRDAQTKLLVDEESKREYDEIYNEIQTQKKQLIININRLSGVKKDDLEKTVISDFQANNFFNILEAFLKDEGIEDVSDIKYIEIFNPEVIAFLSKAEVQEHIELYFQKYNDLLNNSKVFKTGVFNPSKAEIVAVTLNKENFFSANHKVILEGTDTPFSNYTELNAKLLDERKEILENADLLLIEKEITKTAVKNFRELLERKKIVSEFKDLEGFRKKLWKSYFEKHRFHIETLVQTYKDGISRLNEIEEKAKEQSTAWDTVIKTFNDRFFVPFEVKVENKASSILGKDVPNVNFVFKDSFSGNEAILTTDEIKKQDLLSQGEKRAMYLMNILFNVEAKRSEGIETLFIIDDIADSFDYKNKYAIIQYLIDISKESNFYQIILTHNFDFFRTLQSRILGEQHRRTCSFIAVKSPIEIELLASGDKYQNNPFNSWKNRLDERQCLLAAIPFVRNLVEFKEGHGSNDFKTLTSLLHQKPDTSTITIAQLKVIFNSTINCRGLDSYLDEEKIYDLLQQELIHLEAVTIPIGINLEEKIILSIGIRIEAEKYMWSKITNQVPISGNQTGKLFDRFKSEFGGNLDSEIQILDRVNLITPENIHVNSFMFEPILDLSIDHLKQLYSEVKNLN